MPSTAEQKSHGVVYTPPETVDMVLDIAGYVVGSGIVGKTVLEPSCGDGAFLRTITDRLLTECSDTCMSPATTRDHLISDIHAVELDAAECEQAKRLMCDVAARHGVDVDPSDLVNIVCGDAVELLSSCDDRFDFVVGNPPYVRIHNVDMPSLSCLRWCSGGMTDLYYAFYELGDEHLSSDGVLCYIAPSSWLTSKAGRPMRNDLRASRGISRIVDLGHEQVFDGIASYVAITKLTAVRNDTLRYETVDAYRYEHVSYDDDDSVSDATAPSTSAHLDIPYDDAFIGDALMPVPQSMRVDIADIVCGNHDTGIRVRNGYATLLDGFFVRDDDVFGEDVTIPCVKASTGERHRIVFPYDKLTLEPIDADKFMSMLSDDAVTVARESDGRLRARSNIKPGEWLLFGRSQGIADTNVDKVAVNTLYRSIDDVKAVDAPAGTGVYGGVYVVGMSRDSLVEALSDDVFWSYIKSLRKYKSGGYWTLGGKELERYLNWYVDMHRR